MFMSMEQWPSQNWKAVAQSFQVCGRAGAARRGAMDPDVSGWQWVAVGGSEWPEQPNWTPCSSKCFAWGGYFGFWDLLEVGTAGGKPVVHSTSIFTFHGSVDVRGRR